MFDKDIQTSIELGVDLMKDIVAAGYSFLKEKNKERDFFGVATKKYVSGLIERYNNVKVLGMREPVPLKKLYVRANILEKISAEHRGVRLEDLEKSFDRDRRTFGKTTEPVDGEAIANRLQKFIVLGKPGAGKTTYLRFLTLMMLDPKSGIEKQNRRLPIFVTLHDWAQRSVPLMKYLTEQFDICGFEEAQDFVKQMLEQGKCLVVFDGLDEVSREADQDGIIRQIRDFADKYLDNQFIISCRVAAYNHWFERFTDVEMADFNDEQIETFIHNWFHRTPKVASDCWERLNASPQLSELASVPLLLTLICVAFEENFDFPPNRAELYKEAIDALLKKWDASRQIRRSEIYKNLSLQRKEDLFARIAVGTFLENQYFIPERVLTQQIRSFIEHLAGFEEAKLDLDSETVLKSIEAQHGIFVERAKSVHSFAHLTFQEYFTAKYIVDNAKNEKSPLNLEKLVNYHLYDDRWAEVFILVSGMLHSADELLLLMLQKNRSMLHSKELNDLLSRIEEVLLPDKEKYPKTVLNTFGVFLTRARARSLARLFARNRNINRNRAYDRARIIARDRAHDLAITLTFNDALNLSLGAALIENLDYALNLIRVLNNSINIDHAYAFGYQLDHYNDEFMDATIELEVSNFEKASIFLKGNILIANCIQSDAYISKPLRQKILNELLMPINKEE
ncbi:MAG TPA: NACHT domain-containing protein [Saprospiraceae bacterium]|nr:NACHT domain-containing protein [Saprospiraceae bacterium]